MLTRIGLDESRIVFEEVWTPEEWGRRFGLYDGSAFGAAHTLFQMGPFRARNYSESLRGLLGPRSTTWARARRRGPECRWWFWAGEWSRKGSLSVRIESYGTGPRAFFGLHGWSGDHRTFAPLLADLPDDVTFYSADLPGCGASPAPQSWTVDAVADEITQAIQAIGKPVTLVGNCTGANLGFFVAERIPDRLERLITIDAFAFWPWYFSVFLNPVFGRYAYFTTFENPVGRWITNLSLSSKRKENTSLTEGFERVDHRATYRYLEMLHRAGEVERFRGLRMPIDVTFGEKSFAGVRESASRFAEMWPQAHITCIPGAGHLPIREATSVLRAIIFSPQTPDRDIKDSECPRLSTSYAS